MNNNNLFHIHTYRCGHAENINDEKYILKAIEKQYTDIWFSDHAPFPNNPFGGRMKFEELNEYKYLGNAIIKGIQSEYFDYIAHPDRIFRKCDNWNNDMEKHII